MERKYEIHCDWQTQREKIAERGKYILKTGIWSDCSFFVGIETNKKEFKAHKLILSMASPVFDAMFHYSFQEKNNTIQISDVQPEAFGTLLAYIYTDELKLHSFDQACELCYVANKYMMPNLVKQCTSYIWKDVDYTSVCRAYEFAKLFDQEQLMEKCKQIIRDKTSKVLKDPSFLEVEINTLHMILEQQQLNISSELEIFEAVSDWVNNEAYRKGIEQDEEKKKELAEPLLQKIRFLSLSPCEFAEGPGRSSLLCQSTAFTLLLAVASPSNPSLRGEAGWPKGWERCPFPRRSPPIPYSSIQSSPLTLTPLYNSLHPTLPGALFLRLNSGPLVPFYNPGDMETSFLFTINIDAQLHFIQMVTKLMVLGAEGPSQNSGYQEEVTAWVQDEELGEKLATATVTIHAAYNSVIEVGLSWKLKSGKRYRLGGKLGTVGWVAAPAPPSQETSPPPVLLPASPLNLQQTSNHLPSSTLLLTLLPDSPSPPTSLISSLILSPISQESTSTSPIE